MPQCEVVGTDEFDQWFQSLDDSEAEAVALKVDLLEREGIALGFPTSTHIRGTRTTTLRELRVQCGGNAIRVLYAFDPARNAVLLLGGTKRSESWYEEFIPRAEALYRQYLIDTGQTTVMKMKGRK